MSKDLEKSEIVDKDLLFSFIETLEVLYIVFENIVEDIQLENLYKKMAEAKGNPNYSSSNGWSLEKEMEYVQFSRAKAKEFLKTALSSGYYNKATYLELKDIAKDLIKAYNIILRVLKNTRQTDLIADMIFCLNQIIEVVNKTFAFWNKKVISLGRDNFEIPIHLEELKTIVK
jgi:hypothetical protein